MGLVDFKKALAGSESSGSYTVVASTGKAFGKYQFTRERLDEIIRRYDLVHFTTEEFLDHPELQESIFDKHVELMREELQDYDLYKFVGREVTGANKWPYTTTINDWGLLGGAHLAGAYGVKVFLVNNEDRHDKYGTYTSDYISKFSMLAGAAPGKKNFKNKIAEFSPVILLGLTSAAYMLFKK